METSRARRDVLGQPPFSWLFNVAAIRVKLPRKSAVGPGQRSGAAQSAGPAKHLRRTERPGPLLGRSQAQAPVRVVTFARELSMLLFV